MARGRGRVVIGGGRVWEAGGKYAVEEGEEVEEVEEVEEDCPKKPICELLRGRGGLWMICEALWAPAIDCSICKQSTTYINN